MFIIININGDTMPAPNDYQLLTEINTKLDTLIASGSNVNLASLQAALTGIQNTANAIQADLEPAPDQIPTVSAVAPANGSVNGGEVITLTGTNFTGATGVLFGTVAGTGLKVASDTSLSVTSPAQPAATVDVTVVDAAGTSAVSPADKYVLA